MHCLTASYLGTTQSTSAADFHSLGSSLDSTENCLFHSPSVSNPVFNLLSYCSGYQIGIQFRLPNLLNI
jgi:hypothetical protein